MTAEIAVQRAGESFDVTVSEGASVSRHHVTARDSVLARLAPDVAPEEAVAAAFRFLLDREPKDSILTNFDVSVISRYFPEFERTLAGYLPGGGAPPSN
jgi:hypothetical protein